MPGQSQATSAPRKDFRHDPETAQCGRAAVPVGDVPPVEIGLAEDRRGVAGLAEISVDETGTSHLDKLFVEPTRLGEGTGKMLYVWACRFAQGLGAHELVIDADPDAAPFYIHMGAEQTGETESGSLPGRYLPRLVHRL